MSRSPSSPESPDAPSRLQWRRAGGRALGDPVVAVALLVLWSFTLVHNIPIDVYASNAIARLDPSQIAAGQLGFVLVGLLGTVFAWGFLTRRGWGYIGSTVMAGLWVAPVGRATRVVLFVVFWYLVVIDGSTLKR